VTILLLPSLLKALMARRYRSLRVAGVEATMVLDEIAATLAA
jgi:hypothetical protein